MNKLVIITLATFIGSTAFAKMDTQAKLDQLKTNSANADSNYEQYKVNYKISLDNQKQTKAVIEELKVKKTQLLSNSTNIENNKLQINKMKKKILTYKELEAKKLEKDLAEINKLTDLLEKMKKQKLQRENNILAYDQKVQEIELEKQNWDKQKLMMKEIVANIDKKSKQVISEQSKWTSKSKSYKKEMNKWKKESKVANRTYNKYSNLAD